MIGIVAAAVLVGALVTRFGSTAYAADVFNARLQTATPSIDAEL